MTATNPGMTVPDRRNIEGVVNIANGANVSDAIDVNGLAVLGFQLPAAWTAAGVSFQASKDNSTYGILKYEGTEYTAASLVASDFVTLNPQAFIGVRWLKLVSGTSGTGVNQGGARAISLITAPILV